MKKKDKDKAKKETGVKNEDAGCDGYCPHCPKAKEEGILDPDFDIEERDLKKQI